MRAIFLLILFLITALLGSNANAQSATPLAQDGILDLRGWDFSAKGSTIALKGEFDFAWREFTPADTAFPADKYGTTIAPQTWRDQEFGGEVSDGRGYGTYHLRILLPANTPPLAIRTSSLTYAAAIYVNGDLITSVGRPGTDKQSEHPRNMIDATRLPFAFSDGEALELVVHYSNFIHARGGMTSAIQLGAADQLMTSHRHFEQILVGMFGSGIALTILYLMAYFSRWHYRPPLYFALLLLSVATHISVNNGLFGDLFPMLVGGPFLRLEYLSILGSSFFCYLFSAGLYPQSVNKFVDMVVRIYTAIAVLSLLTLTSYQFSFLLPFYQLGMMFCVAAVIGILATAACRREEDGLFLLIGVLAAFIGLSIGLSMQTQIATPPWLYAYISIGLIVISQAITLGRHIARTAARSELLRAKLTQANEQLETRVAARTSELQASQERFSLAVEGSHDGIWDWANIERDEAYWSPQFKKLLGYDDDEITASYSDFGSRLHEDDVERVAEDFKSAESFNSEFRLRTKSGEYRWFRAKAVTKMDEDGKPRRMVGSLSDVTEQRTTQDELIKEKKIAEAANRVKSDFLSAMSHEIRTPMNGVIGMTEAVLDGELPDEQRQNVNVIKQSADALMVILNDILDISKIEAGKMTLETRAFSLDNVIKSALALWQEPAAQKGLKLKTQIEGDICGYVMGDEIRLGQVLSNLLSNACKFTAKGHVKLAISTNIIGDKAALEFRVEDTGAGISPDKVANIFEAFTQEDQTISRRYGGTGLGLNICTQLADLMGGTLAYDSDYKDGAAFVLTLTLPTANAPAKALESNAKTPKPKTRRLKLLAAEDNAINRKVMQALLGKMPFDLIFAEDGLKAVAMAQAEPFDVILMDIQMPNMGGEEATQIIQGSNGPNAQTPIIALTANAMAGAKEQYLAAGMQGFVAKPIDAKTLIMAISAAANSRKASNTANGKASEQANDRTAKSAKRSA